MSPFHSVKDSIKISCRTEDNIMSTYRHGMKVLNSYSLFSFMERFLFSHLQTKVCLKMVILKMAHWKHRFFSLLYLFFLGWIYDQVGSYDLAFVVMGCVLVPSLAALSFEWISRRYRGGGSWYKPPARQCRSARYHDRAMWTQLRMIPRQTLVRI